MSEPASEKEAAEPPRKQPNAETSDVASIPPQQMYRQVKYDTECQLRVRVYTLERELALKTAEVAELKKKLAGSTDAPQAAEARLTNVIGVLSEQVVRKLQEFKGILDAEETDGSDSDSSDEG